MKCVLPSRLKGRC